MIKEKLNLKVKEFLKSNNVGDSSYYDIFSSLLPALEFNDRDLASFNDLFFDNKNNFSANERYLLYFKYYLLIIENPFLYQFVDDLIRRCNETYFSYEFLFNQLMENNDEETLIKFLKSEIFQTRLAMILSNYSKGDSLFSLLLKNIHLNDIYFNEGFYLSLIKPPYQQDFVHEILKVGLLKKYDQVIISISSFYKEKLSIEEIKNILSYLGDAYPKERTSLADFLLKNKGSFEIYLYYKSLFSENELKNKKYFIVQCAEKNEFYDEYRIYHHENVNKAAIQALPNKSLFLLKNELQTDFQGGFINILVKRINKLLLSKITNYDIFILLYLLKENSYASFLEITQNNIYQKKIREDELRRRDYLRFLYDYHLLDEEGIKLY